MAKSETVVVTLKLSEDSQATLDAIRQSIKFEIDTKAVDAAIRDVISDIDYDIHKSLESDEETGEDTYPEVAAAFIRAYKKAVSA
jgi:hypothetical protein